MIKRINTINSAISIVGDGPNNETYRLIRDVDAAIDYIKIRHNSKCYFDYKEWIMRNMLTEKYNEQFIFILQNITSSNSKERLQSEIELIDFY